MSTYRPQGRSHGVLHRLELGPASLADLRAYAAVEHNANWRREHWYCIAALIEDGMVVRAGTYRITPAGRELLADLDAGLTRYPATPSVRVFSREATA